MKYGHFSSDGTEYVVTDPVTPRPWINYLTNEKYCAIISHCAGGYSFFRDCRTDRILRWAPENWHFDRPGRYVYLRDEESGKYWSATYQPVREKPESFECRHGLGYTVISSQTAGIESEITYFVPEKDNCEVWIAKVKNLSDTTRTLLAFPYIEWLIGDYHMELRYRNIMNLYNRVWYSGETGSILAKKTAQWNDMNIQPFQHLLFFQSHLPSLGAVTRKESFLGKYNTEERPEMVATGRFESFEAASGEDSIAAYAHRLVLKPGETKEWVIVLGQADDEKQVKALGEKYSCVLNAKKELEITKFRWRERIFGNVRIETPDQDVNIMTNIWAKYQLYICNLWSRSPSYYHEGSGGRGYRDSCQDAEGLLAIDAGHSRKKILSLIKLIRKDGTTAPGWSDSTGPFGFRPNKDHPVWLTVTVSSYIKETGDIDILLEESPYLEDKWIDGWFVNDKWSGPARFSGNGTVFDHLVRNLNFTFNDVGERGLPRIGHADWNDAIDAAGIKHKGESVMIAMQLVRSLKVLAELAELINEKAKARELRERAKVMTERIETICWDGNWYKRGFTDDGTVYGSHANKEGSIFINTQNWAILAGIPNRERQEKVLASVDRYLDGPHGYALFHPAYSKWDAKLGRISMFSEGTKENAAVFCHAATFMAAANCAAGRGNKAYEAIKKIMPNKQRDLDVYKTEPYVFAEYLIGPGHPYLYGEGAFTWITGTAGWYFMAVMEWMLGIRHDYKGLLIDPCLPSTWKKCSVTRIFRGTKYDITIENPDGLEKGEPEVYVDGVKINGNLILANGSEKNCTVRVFIRPLTKAASRSEIKTSARPSLRSVE